MISKWITVSYIVLIIGIIAIADRGGYTAWFSLIYQIPYGDKLGHFLFIGTLSLVVNLSLNCVKTRIWGRSIFKGSAIIFFLITFEEISQIFLPNRTFDLGDLFFNYLGILIFSMGLSLSLTMRKESA